MIQNITTLAYHTTHHHAVRQRTDRLTHETRQTSPLPIHLIYVKKYQIVDKTPCYRGTKYDWLASRSQECMTKALVV